MPIRRLSPLLVNQIAAGEVIERPASVVKECIENSIDAGATRIAVSIEAGGRELIRVTDDGCGIAMDELALAVAPHATSKIEAQGDLDSIATMGFRGEALASIASVSRLSILSRPPEQPGAGLIEVEGDCVQGPRPASGAPGTAVTVRNLFFNTPARRKFLRTEQTESGRVSDVVQNLALSHPAAGVTLTVDGRKTLDLPPGQSPRRRALEILGSDLDDMLLEFEVEERGTRMWGLAGKPEIARGTARHMRVFLNGRVIADRSINHALKEAYRGLIDPTRSPTVVLFLFVPPEAVDVNVHPAKAEVRFRNQGAVHGAVLSAVRSALRKADLMPAVSFGSGSVHAGGLRGALAPPPGEFGTGLGEPADSRDAPTHNPASAIVEYVRRLDPKQKGFALREARRVLAEEDPVFRESLAADDASWSDRQQKQVATDAAPEPTLGQLRQVENILQVHSSYIVTQDDDGLVIIDQHALHERIIFEKLMQRLRDGTLESQRLLMPATVEVDRRQMELLEALQPMLAKLGIEAEPMGPAAIAVHAFTSLLFERNVDPAVFMSELLNRAEREGLADDSEAALHEVLDMMACKAAIKAGDRLSAEELAELLRSRDGIERSSNCPHGRPTSLRLSLRDLEKQFGRR